jgi:hypothetical protein
LCDIRNVNNHIILVIIQAGNNTLFSVGLYLNRPATDNIINVYAETKPADIIAHSTVGQLYNNHSEYSSQSFVFWALTALG